MSGVSGETIIKAQPSACQISKVHQQVIRGWNGRDYVYMSIKEVSKLVNDYSIYKITLKDGRTLVCSEYQKFLIDPKPVSITLKELINLKNKNKISSLHIYTNKANDSDTFDYHDIVKLELITTNIKLYHVECFNSFHYCMFNNILVDCS